MNWKRGLDDYAIVIGDGDGNEFCSLYRNWVFGLLFCYFCDIIIFSLCWNIPQKAYAHSSVRFRYPPKTIVNELNAIVTGWFIDRFCKSGHTFIESTSRRWVSENPTRNAKWKGLITVEKTRCARAIEKSSQNTKNYPPTHLVVVAAFASLVPLHPFNFGA